MRRVVEIVLAAVALLAMSSCSSGIQVSGGDPVPASQGLTGGNWFLVATSQAFSQGGNTFTTNLGGPLAATGNAVNGMLAPSIGCLVTFEVNNLGVGAPAPVSFVGSMNGNAMSLANSPSVNGAVTTITGTLINGSLLNGTYSSQGGPALQFNNHELCNGDYGTVYGTLVPPITGSWSGKLTNLDNDPNNLTQGPSGDTVSVTASLVQGEAQAGSFPLSGSIELQINNTSGLDLSCYGAGDSFEIDGTQSSILGDAVTIIANDTTNNGNVLTLNAYLANPNTAIQIGAPITPVILTSSACSSYIYSQGILNKQSN
jgi:hypothetical protein